MPGKKQKNSITIHGARQNNLKNLSLEIPLDAITVITGVSGSGKSSLAFDTIYAEGQRRYITTFSSYARQFLDRMDRPQVDRIDGLPPAIAINQINPVRTSRSTVGTMTELNDHLKLLFSRAAFLTCGSCGQRVVEDTPATIWSQLSKHAGQNTTLKEALITFPVTVPHNFSKEELLGHLSGAGYHRIHKETDTTLTVIQDRVTITCNNRDRIIEDIEAALHHGNGHVTVYNADDTDIPPMLFSSGFHCAICDIDYAKASANHFSFNSPVGACERCRGFGRIIGIDRALVVPDEEKSLRQGAVKPFQSPSYQECQDDLLRFARRRSVPVDIPWRDLDPAIREWVFAGDGDWNEGVWYGIDRFFKWLESRSYKMHVRVQLSRYRAYHICDACNGARLKPESLLWRIGKRAGKNIHELMRMPINDCDCFFSSLKLPAPYDEAAEIVLNEIRTRLGYLVEIGLGYLTLDRQSRTLSGGEVQRINLTTALGTSLVNTLFILDEPSIGLHSRDIGKMIALLHRLRDAGNTLVIVEHDPELINAADRVIDMGPQPGINGGAIVFQGTVPALHRNRKSLTATYLSGRKSIVTRGKPFAVDTKHALVIHGATEHNLKNIDVSIPLRSFVGISGVSGSGKSTLIHDVLYRGLCRKKGIAVETPGTCNAITGAESIEDVILVDQSSIGKTTRSNPASYIGAYDPIRKLFAAQPLARERHYTNASFSFNSGTGRCPVCNGAGFEVVEMQFLSDVNLSCPQCRGKRFKPEVREVTVNGAGRDGAKSVDEILSLTVEEAVGFFADHPAITAPLSILMAVGLSYLPLGQPLSTLSGGEAQRLKLAAHLPTGRQKKREHQLFLFDEPTTGLHFSDIAVLIDAFRKLIDAGHSVVVIEHNLDVLRAVDWLIDLGPEGGDNGGTVVFTGTPHNCLHAKNSHTGKALSAIALPLTVSEPVADYGGKTRRINDRSSMIITGAREHNLKSVDITIPRDRFTVITGVSGSGKSTVAFDILFSEGQRRYLESLNAYARQFVQPPPRPDVDRLSGIPPTVAIEQRTSRGGRKSTVATVTELYHYIRLLFVKTGVQHCPDCGVPVKEQSVHELTETLFKRNRRCAVTLLAPMVTDRKGIYNDLAAWASANGYPELRVDGEMIATVPWPKLDRYREHTIELPVATFKRRAATENDMLKAIQTTILHGRGILHLLTGDTTVDVYSTSRMCPSCHRGFEEPDPRLFSYNSRHGWCRRCFGTGLYLRGFDEEQSGEEATWNEWWDGTETPCPSCKGNRLRPEALSIMIDGKNIAHFTSLSVAKASSVFEKMRFTGRNHALSRDIMPEIASRLHFLSTVGLGYLTLDRSAPTLSGGEAQRVRLAGQLGSHLRGVCYILDEPTIGLHSRDNARLLSTLRSLQQQGNSVVVVEHDEETIRQADYLIDIGPGGGSRGGAITASGKTATVLRSKKSVTAACLRKKKHCSHPPRDPADSFLTIRNATLHNLKSLTVDIPLRRLVTVTGVSGSGKSTLVRSILHDNISRLLSRKRQRKEVFKGCEHIDNVNLLSRVLEVDQKPIGKTPRSCPATYVGIWDHIRKLFAAATESKLRGYNASRFSFNTENGRCPVCKGQGVLKIAMNFLPDVTILCDVCEGKRFTDDTLAVEYRGKTISDVLSMSIDTAVGFFEAHPPIHHPLKLLQEVGLGYLTLGQQSPTLSGGEAQRIKLVTELSKVKPASSGRSTRKTAANNHTLFILDEPTVGLHMADIVHLMKVIHQLVDTGSSVVIIEHNLDVIAQSDWIIDLGPDGGDNGGEVLVTGTPETVAGKRGISSTGKFLYRHITQ